MAKGGFPGGMGNILKQAQKMQKDMMAKQEELAEMTIEASSGGGVVTVVVTGDKTVKEINIKPEVVDPDDIEMLQDLVVAAVNEALAKADEVSQSELGKLTGGLGGMPGMF